ncbi:hypothetical protein AB0D74_41460 [Streptomyces sp. NPDC048278]|uniref:hypothetical protein n=1 Tax=Streptomyces sp. NPDC048278 TaxID=3155809 RepID=UPI0034272F5A
MTDMAVTARGVLLLTEGGRILRWTPGERSGTEVGRTTIAPVAHGHAPRQGDETFRLHASEDGLFAAVVIDHGRYGEVIDLTTGRVTLPLRNDGYCSTTVPFSCTFTLHEQRCVVVYRDRWNRLRACEAATGRSLTQMPTDDEGAPWVSVFHGAALASPGGSRIVSDAWHWPGFGSVLVWNLETWLGKGDAAWPAAVGFSQVAGGRDLWNRPLVWLDEDSLIVGGIGGSRQTMVDGATVYRFSRTDAQQPEMTSFAGPRGRFFVVDGLLCSVGHAGTDVWDPQRGARIAVIPGFRPTHRGRGDGELLHLDSATATVRGWSIRRTGTTTAARRARATSLLT